MSLIPVLERDYDMDSIRKLCSDASFKGAALHNIKRCTDFGTLLYTSRRCRRGNKIHQPMSVMTRISYAVARDIIITS